MPGTLANSILWSKDDAEAKGLHHSRLLDEAASRRKHRNP